MKVFVAILSFILVYLPFKGSTQTSATGCLITSATANYNKVYSSKNINLLTSGYVLYNNISPTSLSPGYCGWSAISVTGNACEVCSNLGLCALGICVCIGSLETGYEGSFNMVLCDLDDHSWVLGLAAGAFGLIIIRRRKLL